MNGMDGCVRVVRPQAGRAMASTAGAGACATFAVLCRKKHRVYALAVGGGTVVVCRDVPFGATLAADDGGGFGEPDGGYGVGYGGGGGGVAALADVAADGRGARGEIEGIRRAGRALDVGAVAEGHRHVLGFAACKSATAAAGYARAARVPEPAVVPAARRGTLKVWSGVRQLAPGDVHVLLLSSGFLDAVGLADAAALANTFSAPAMAAVARLHTDRSSGCAGCEVWGTRF
eukprot:358813-Chlamydomonas_euryale.AAC.2